jgi:hypothetical protein
MPNHNRFCSQQFLLKFSLNIKCTEIQWNYGRVVMDQEEALKRLQKTRKENEEAYLKAKAFMDGFRARGQLSQKDSEFLFLMEFVIKGFKNHGNDIITAFENQVRFTEAFNNLQLKVNDIEHEINQLKKTLDKMYQDR